MADQNRYAIIRHNKLATREKIAKATAHNNRTSNPHNADPNGKCILVGGSNNPLDSLDKLIEKYGIKVRSNACLAGEYLLTFSPEMAGKIDLKDWVSANLNFIANEHSKESILSAHLHLDETTPHLHIVTAPLIEKEITNRKNKTPKIKMRLSANDFWGGRKMLADRHTRYAEAMEDFGLERGRKVSGADHKTIKDFYKDLDKTRENVMTLHRKNVRKVNRHIEGFKAHKAEFEERMNRMTEAQKAEFNKQNEALKAKSIELSQREIELIEQETELELMSDKSLQNTVTEQAKLIESLERKVRLLNEELSQRDMDADFSY